MALLYVSIRRTGFGESQKLISSSVAVFVLKLGFVFLCCSNGVRWLTALYKF